MAAYPECETRAVEQKVWRVIDDGDCILTTLDPVKALRALSELIEKHDVTACWVDEEKLR